MMVFTVCGCVRISYGSEHRRRILACVLRAPAGMHWFDAMFSQVSVRRRRISLSFLKIKCPSLRCNVVDVLRRRVLSSGLQCVPRGLPYWCVPVCYAKAWWYSPFAVLCDFLRLRALSADPCICS